MPVLGTRPPIATHNEYAGALHVMGITLGVVVVAGDAPACGRV
ncbi:hypothetical protein ACFVZR_38245 [Streptomyces sp. NPDC058316]